MFFTSKLNSRFIDSAYRIQGKQQIDWLCFQLDFNGFGYIGDNVFNRSNNGVYTEIKIHCTSIECKKYKDGELLSSDHLSIKDQEYELKSYLICS